MMWSASRRVKLVRGMRVAALPASPPAAPWPPSPPPSEALDDVLDSGAGGRSDADEEMRFGGRGGGTAAAPGGEHLAWRASLSMGG